MKTAALLCTAALLAACADTPPPTAAATQAVTTPLADLNIVRADIPAPLVAAQKGPYAPPAERTCASIGAEIQALDGVLGADLDTPPDPDRPSLIERGAGAVGNAAVGAIRGAAEGLVPYRSWVRKLTGAERYSREVAAAIAAGTIRRAYLKGLGLAGGCAVPAAPRLPAA